jgi:hypothetical protein
VKSLPDSTTAVNHPENSESHHKADIGKKMITSKSSEHLGIKIF